MNTLMKVLRDELQRCIDNIDAGNSNMTDDEILHRLKIVRELSAKDTPMSKYQSFNYLHISRATFDNLVREGKIPKGVKQQGFNELQWFKKDLDEYRENKIKNNI